MVYYPNRLKIVMSSALIFVYLFHLSNVQGAATPALSSPTVTSPVAQSPQPEKNSAATPAINLLLTNKTELARIIDFTTKHLPYMTRPALLPDFSQNIPETTPPLPSTAPPNRLRDIINSILSLLQTGANPSLLLAFNDFTLALEKLNAPPDIPAVTTYILQGVGNVYAAIQLKEIDPAEEENIIRPAAELARYITLQLLNGLTEQGADPAKIRTVSDALTAGDGHLSIGDYNSALQQYTGVMLQAFLFFSIDTFESNITNAMTDNALGYAYAINMNGTLSRNGSYGLARTAYNLPEMPHDVNIPQEVASVSKPITAVALLRLLDQNNISVDDSIDPYLPSSWNTDFITWPYIPLSFRDLLYHESNLNGNSYAKESYAELKSYIEAGTGFDPKEYTYENGNYAMFRILIPGLMGFDITSLALSMNITEEEAAASMYEYYMHEFIFAPLGITQETLLPRGTYPTLLNGFPATESSNLGGMNLDGNYFLISGAFGRYLSALELAKFLRTLRYTNTLLSPNTKQQMYDERLGWFNKSGQYGKYIEHGGDWTWTPAGKSDSHEAHACMVNYPNNVEAAVVISSARTFSQCPVLRDAYDGAFLWGLN